MPSLYLSKHLTVRVAKCYIMAQAWIILGENGLRTPKSRVEIMGRSQARPLVLTETTLPVKEGQVDNFLIPPLSLNLGDLK